jgi:hypothetical protein
MLQDYIQLLLDNNLHLTDQIKDLEKSCCASSQIVIDYDKVKDQYCKIVRQKTIPKSCDALLIEPKKDRVTFIEMKAIEVLIEELNKTASLQEAKDLVKFIFEKQFGASKKILDSIFLFLDIARNFGINDNFFPYFLSDHCDKKIYFVLGCTQRDFVRWSLALSSQRYTYEYFKIGQPEFIPANNFDALLHP